MAPLLGYLNIRGYAQPIRLLLEYLELEYQEKRYDYAPPPSYEKTEWLQEKFALGLHFPNIPYWIDGDLKITQQVAIMRYLGRKHGLDGKSDEEKIRIDMAEQFLIEVRNGYGALAYNSNYDQLKPDYLAAMPVKLKQLSDFLGPNPWFGGANLSYVDFLIYEFLDVHLYVSADVLDAFPSLKQFHARLEALPTVDKFIKSPKFLRWPINGDMAGFASKYHPAP